MDGEGVAPAGSNELASELREVLRLERMWWTLGMPKERAIRERLGLTPARYHQLLERAIGRPEALELDPMLVLRLRRLRELRRRARQVRPLGLGA
jgi:hypothetical protein